MSRSSKHERVSELFLEAAKLHPDQRGAFLDSACEGDDLSSATRKSH